MAYSPAPLALDRAKPSQWNAGQGFISPEYQRLWRGLVFLTPTWQGSSQPRDLIQNLGSTLIDNGPTPTWQASPAGIARRFNRTSSSTSSSAADSFGNLAVLNFGSNDDFSLLLAFVHTGNRDNINTYFAKGVGGGETAGWKLAVNTFETNDHKFLFESGDGVTPILLDTATNAVVDGRFHVAAVTRGSGTARLYFDGLERDVASHTLNMANTRGVFIGAMGTTGSATNYGANGFVVMAAGWTRALSASEVAQLASDPFGLVRPNWNYLTTSAFDPANLQASVLGSDVTLTWDV